MIPQTSRLLVLLNRMKAEARPDWLTDSQASALAEVQRLWRFPERVNLYGPPGSGKTLLGWTVTRSSGARFYASPRVYLAQAEPGQIERAVIDNVPEDITALRRLLAALQLNNVRTALLITSRENRLGLPSVSLREPTSTDIDVVYRNLSLLDHYAITPTYATNLWRVVTEAL